MAGSSHQSQVSISQICLLSLAWVVLQERACQLTARLSMHDSPHMLNSLRGLVALCNPSVAAPVREQACHALLQIAKSTAGLTACAELQALGATQTLLQLLKGTP